MTRSNPELLERINRVRRSGISENQSLSLKAYVAGKDPEKLRDLPFEFILQEVAGLAKKFGIRGDNLDAENVKAISTLIQSTYGYLSVSELQLAVDLWIQEKLTDAAGKTLAAGDHYQSFSVAYVAKWLAAFKRFKLEAVKEANRLLPPPEPKVNPLVEKYRAELEERIGILNAFQEYEKSARVPEIAVSASFWQTIEANKWYEVTDQEKYTVWTQAGAKLKKEDNASTGDYLAAVLQKKSGVDPTRYARQSIARTICLEKAFEHWKKTGLDLFRLFDLELCETEIGNKAEIVSLLIDGIEPVANTTAEILGAVYQTINSN